MPSAVLIVHKYMNWQRMVLQGTTYKIQKIHPPKMHVASASNALVERISDTYAG